MIWEGDISISIFDQTLKEYIKDIQLSLVTQENYVGQTDDAGTFKGPISIWWGQTLRSAEQTKGPKLYLLKPGYCEIITKIPIKYLSNDKELSLLIVLVHSLNSNREEISVYKIQHMRNSGIDCEIRRNDGKLLDK